MQPQHRTLTSDIRGTDLSFGIAATSLVATPGGWVRLESLGPGDMVYTLDAGPLPLIRLQKPKAQPVFPAICLPSGSFGNRSAQSLLPGQPVLVQSDVGEAQFGAADTLLPALALLGWRGAHACAAEVLFLIPSFARSVLIYVGPGLILSCPGPHSPHSQPPHSQPPLTAQMFAGLLADPGIPCLSLQQGLDLVNCLMAEDVGAALGTRPQAAC